MLNYSLYNYFVTCYVPSMIILLHVTYVQTFIVLLIPSVVIPIWYNMMKKIEKHVETEASYARYQLVTKVEDVAKLIYPINSTSINVASILGTHITRDKLVFSDIQNKVYILRIILLPFFFVVFSRSLFTTLFSFSMSTN